MPRIGRPTRFLVPMPGRRIDIGGVGGVTPPPVSGGSFYNAENKDIVTVLRGQPVTVHSSGTGFVRANASDNTKHTVGLLDVDTNVGASNNIITDGVFYMGDWTNVIGSATLAPKSDYFLDTVSGKLTTTPPIVPGQVSQPIGHSLSLTSLSVEIEDAILL